MKLYFIKLNQDSTKDLNELENNWILIKSVHQNFERNTQSRSLSLRESKSRRNEEKFSFKEKPSQKYRRFHLLNLDYLAIKNLNNSCSSFFFRANHLILSSPKKEIPKKPVPLTQINLFESNLRQGSFNIYFSNVMLNNISRQLF